MDSAARFPARPGLLHAVLFQAGALALFLLLLNRFFIHMRGGPAKTLFIAASLVALAVGARRLARRVTGRRSVLLPLAPIAVLLALELHGARLATRLAGSPPVEIDGPAPSIWRPVTTLDLRILRYEVALRDWRGPAFRIVHVTDLHRGDRLPANYFVEAMARIDGLRGDLLLHTGDYGLHGVGDRRLPALLALAKGRLGTFAARGNHDYWRGSRPIFRAFHEAGVRFLSQGGTRVEIAPGHSVVLSSCENPWGKELWQPPQRAPDEPLVVLSHSPDNVFRLARKGASLCLSGHTHGGQVLIPGLGPPVVPSLHGRTFAHGHFLVNGCHLFVSAGVGVSTIPLRLWCPPDVFVIDVRAGNDARAGGAEGLEGARRPTR